MASHDGHRRRSSARNTSLTAPNATSWGPSVAHRGTGTKVASPFRGVVVAPWVGCAEAGIDRTGRARPERADRVDVKVAGATG